MIDPNDAAASMPPVPMRRETFEYVPMRWPFPGEVGFIPPLESEIKMFMFDNIKVGDNVRVNSWLPVTAIDEDNITIADRITLGRESIVGHQQKGRTPDEVWAGLSDEEKRKLIERM